MVTRLYFEATTAAPVSPAFDSNWASNAQAVRRLLRTTQQAATETRSGALAGTADDEDLIVQLISPPLSGNQTVSGTATIVSRGRELAGTDNINSRPRHLRVVKPDLTDRGVLEAYTVPASTTELSTSLAGQQHMTNGGIASVNALDGDRIVVEIGYRESGTGTTPNWEMVLGGTGTDHGSASNNDATGTVPWLEFSANLTFQSGLTAVGDTLQAVWDVRAPIGDAVQALWDVRAPIGDAVQAVWDVRAVLGDPLGLQWDVRAALGDTVQLVWNLSQAVGDPLELKWNVESALTAVGRDLGLPWNVLAVIGDPLDLRWDVRATVGDPLVLQWDVRQAVGDPLGLVWDVLAGLQVGKDLGLVWALRALAADDLGLLWNVQAPPSPEQPLLLKHTRLHVGWP